MGLSPLNRRITPDADDLAGNRDETASTADERLDIAIPESHQ